jgi:D-glycero-alpha-D-manno-heptose-7-phosphate kinase
MIVVQTPLRISYFGGGTDFPDFFQEHGGHVLSTAIDKYIFVTIKHRFDQLLRVGWTRTEMVESVDQLGHELIREAFRLTGIRAGVEITTMGDIPSQGSGLGSSSTVTVGALHAMYQLQGETVLAERLAREACYIERDVLGKPIGIQDQYIVAYGGLRFTTFETNGTVVTERLQLSDDAIRALQDNTLLFFTGATRRSTDILAEQKAGIRRHQAVLQEIKALACAAREALSRGDVDTVGPLLHDSWLLKRELASQISNPAIDDLYHAARSAGALGGKIAGAGGGGFLLLYVPAACQAAVRTALSQLQELPFRFERDGSKVIFNYRR